MIECEEITVVFDTNGSMRRLPYYTERSILHKTSYVRLLTVVTLTSFCFFCIFLALFMLPEDTIQDDDATNSMKPHFVKRTRAVQAFPGPGFIYNSNNNKENSLINVEDFRKVSQNSRKTSLGTADGEENDYYDGTDEEDDYEENEEEEDVAENEAFQIGDFDYEVANSLEIGGSVHKDDQNSLPTAHRRNFHQIFRIRILQPEVSVRKNRVSVRRHRPSYRRYRNVSLVNFDGVPIVEDRIYWSEELEEHNPRGLSDLEVNIVLDKLRYLHVESVQQPTWNQCGRPKNLFIQFEDGSKACARYRAPHQYLVYGELLSFYLSRLLGIHNVPVVTLLSADREEERWSNDVNRQKLSHSQWEPNVTVAFIQWIDDLERDKMPPFLLSTFINRTVISSHNAALYGLSTEELVELLQWSDLIIFDYITGNYDRVASMQDAADKEHRPAILNDTIHNLVRSRTSGSLWLIDNESGLLDSYSLLYGRLGKDGRFLEFHRQMLSLMCLFRRTTVQRIRWLHESGNAGEILMSVVQKKEALFKGIEDSKTLSEHLQNRIDEVHRHISSCYGGF